MSALTELGACVESRRLARDIIERGVVNVHTQPWWPLDEFGVHAIDFERRRQAAQQSDAKPLFESKP